MVKIVKTDRVNNKAYYVDTKTGEILKKYSPCNPNLEFVMELEDGSLLHVDRYKIDVKYSQPRFFYDGTVYIIIDGYEDILVKSGYLVYKNFDEVIEMDIDIGIERRKWLIEEVETIFSKLKEKYDFNITRKGEFSQYERFTREGIEFTIGVENIANLVKYNIARKECALPYYPFIKGMDRYSTLYVSVFARRVEEGSDRRYSISEDLIKDFSRIAESVNEDFHYVPVGVNRSVVKCYETDGEESMI